MTAKKYQIFLSSTFLDLQQQRSAAVTAIMRLGHIPVGMELFPATDAKQWSVIERAIREADYYVLIVGARYGSKYGEVSYTEAEYDFALAQQVPITPLLLKGHAEEFRILGDEDDASLAKLEIFRQKLESNHTCQYWSDDAELSVLLFQGVLEAIDTKPREGWIRGSAAASEETLTELTRVTRERDSLKSDLKLLSEQLKPTIESIASFDDNFEVRFEYTYFYNQRSGKRDSSVIMTWREIFCAAGPQLMNPTSPKAISSALYHYVRENKNVTQSPAFFDTDLATIKIQLISMGLIQSYNASAVTGGISEFVKLTSNGQARLAELMTKRAPTS